MLRYVTSLYEFRVQYDEKIYNLLLHMILHRIAWYCVILQCCTILYHLNYITYS